MNDLGAKTRAAELSALLLAKGADGAFVVGDRPALALLSLLGLAVARADQETELPRFLMQQLGAFTQEAGLQGQPAATQIPALEVFLLGLLPQGLRSEVERFYREQNSLGREQARELGAALGLRPRGGPLDSGTRPAGTVAASPMARFQLVVPSKKD